MQEFGQRDWFRALKVLHQGQIRWSFPFAESFFFPIGILSSLQRNFSFSLAPSSLVYPLLASPSLDGTTTAQTEFLDPHLRCNSSKSRVHSSFALLTTSKFSTLISGTSVFSFIDFPFHRPPRRFQERRTSLAAEDESTAATVRPSTRG